MIVAKTQTSPQASAPPAEAGVLMADIVDLAGAKVIHAERSADSRSRSISEAIADLTKENDRQEIRSVVIVTVDYNNRVGTTRICENKDDVLVIGALEVTKSDLLEAVQSRRTFIPYETADDDD